MQKEDIISSLAAFGQFLGEGSQDKNLLEKAEIHNRWFSPDQSGYCLLAWKESLTREAVTQWLQPYKISGNPKSIGIIMAGNLPLVGLHDLICVLAAGHKAQVKLSSQDEILMAWAIAGLRKINNTWDERITVTEKMNDADAVIATGSNNSARYFDYYFGSIPHIIRKNRTSVAVLTGEETDEELGALADDVYLYYGLGCRNVSHLLLPQGFQLERLFRAFEKYAHYINHNKYHNNYVYHKAILLMNLTPHLDSGFSIWQEKTDLHAPVATLNYHFYQSEAEIAAYLKMHEEAIQCIAGRDYIPFGTTQKPALGDYADNVDTMAFLTAL